MEPKLKITPPLSGEDHLAVLARLHQAIKPKSYFEIGTATGTSLQLSTCASVAVDPDFALASASMITNKPFYALYQMTSDCFFSTVDPTAILGRRVDLAYLDGMHLCEYLLRDFTKTEQYCAKNSIVVLHDCLPLNYEMAKRDRAQIVASNTDYPGWWTGDVWRCAVVLKRKRPDLRIISIDAPPTGLVLIANLNPGANMERSYADLVEEMHSMDLEDISLTGLYSELQVLPTSILGSFDRIATHFWL